MKVNFKLFLVIFSCVGLGSLVVNYKALKEDNIRQENIILKRNKTIDSLYNQTEFFKELIDSLDIPNNK